MRSTRPRQQLAPPTRLAIATACLLGTLLGDGPLQLAAQPSLPAPAPQAAAKRIEELEREARELHLAAQRLRRQGSPERLILLQRAAGLLSRALTLDEHNAELRLLLGSWLASQELGEPALKQSVVELLRARSDDPYGALDCEIAGTLGVVYSHLHRFSDAVAEYDRALRLLPGEPDPAHYPRRQQQSTLTGNSAEAVMALGRLDEAIRRYSLAEQSDRTDQAALHALGLAVAYDRDGQRQKSRDALARALSTDPGLRLFQSKDVFFIPEGDRHYYWGLLHEQFGNPDDALRSFRDFLSEVPTSRYGDRARSHIDELRRQPGLSAAELLRAKVQLGLPQFPPDAESGLTSRRHRSESEIRRVLIERTFELRRCYARSLRQAAGLRGDLLLALRLDRDGAVLLVQVQESTLSDQPRKDDSVGGVGAAELLRCVQGSIYRWRFSEADADIVEHDELELPFRFTAT
jgi:tetratricopeptide (TPR) repeat protein